MEVQNVYQDSEGKWHVDDGLGNVMGLAIRIYFGHILIGWIIAIPALVLSFMMGIALGKSLPEERDPSDIFSSPNRQPESILDLIEVGAKTKV